MGRERDQLAATLAVLVVALLFAWPALINAYPIVFSDTHAFLVQAGEPRMVWDKPWTYGPFLLALHGNTTLWLPLAAQTLMLSHLLWLLAASLGQASPRRHFLLGALLAAGSAAPWFASLLMPDIFAPIAVIGLYLIAFPGDLGLWQRRWIVILTTAAIAFHLSHLIVAASCIAAILCLRPRALLRAGLPLAAALAILLATNIAGYGRAAISPYGSVFALARLTADGLTAPVLARACPAAGWHLCAWRDRLPATSNEFLWNGDGPVWTHPGGAIGFAPEATAIVVATLRHDPLAALRAAAANTITQLGRVALDDTLGPDWLESSIAGSLRAYFPPEEQARFRAARQLHDSIRPLATPLNPVDRALLLIGAAGTAASLLRSGRAFALIVLVGVLANAVATGALSGPHDRYQARIAWLVLLPPALLALRSVPGPRPRPETSAPAAHSRSAASR